MFAFALPADPDEIDAVFVHRGGFPVTGTRTRS
jgi:hypothetical protein